jgi:transcriptional regulator with XRE-family HTH domain
MADNRADKLVKAVKRLRKRLGESQQTFAGRLGLSMSTIANYEGGRCPSGMPLVALERAAGVSGDADLQSIFGDAISDELDAWDFSIITMPATKTRPAHGYIKLKLEGYEKLRGAQDFMSVVSALESPEFREAAIAALESLRKAAQTIDGNPVADQLKDAVSRMWLYAERKGTK